MEEPSIPEERLEHLEVSQERADELKDKVTSIAEENEAEETVEQVVQESTELPLREAVVMQGYVKDLHEQVFVQNITSIEAWNNWYEENREELQELMQPVVKGEIE